MSEIRVPKEQLAQRRGEALRKHRKHKKKRQMMLTSISSIVVLLFAFTLGVRVSPAFANYVAKIPGFAPIVELIEEDKGIRDAMKDGYFEQIGESVTSEKNHITLTVVGVIADYSGLAIAYTVEAPRALADFGHPDVDILQNGEQIPAGFMMDYYPEGEQTFAEGVMMLTSADGIDFTQNDFALQFDFEEVGETLKVPFTLQNDIHEPKTIAEKIELNLQGQQLTVASIVITPMRAMIKFDVDEQNDLQIIAMDGIKLVDERGEEWATIRNGMLSTGSLRGNDYTLFMESNYYREPKSLKLIIGKVAALPKGEDYIEVDLEKGEFLYKPDLPKFSFELQKNHLAVTYPVNEKGFQALGWGLDGKGRDIYDSYFLHDDDHVTQTIEPEEPYVNPVRFNIDYYPNFIGEQIEIEL